METTNIYVLIDPRTDMVRYVGKANNIIQRYKAHINKARDKNTHKRNWVEQLKKEGLKPIIEVVDVVPVDNWVFWEAYWVSQFRTWGFDLMNYTNGGDGLTFANSHSFKKGDGGKKVVGYNSNCEKLYGFNSASEASEFFKLYRSSISSCCGNSNRNKTLKNIAWFYLDDIKYLKVLELNTKIKERFIKENKPNSGNFIKGQKSPKRKKVLMFTLDWIFLKEFESAKSAGEYIGVTGGAVQYACLKSKNNKCKNNKFKYA